MVMFMITVVSSYTFCHESKSISYLGLDQLLDVSRVGVLGAREERIGQLDVGFLGGVVGIPEKIVVSVEAESHVGQTWKQAVVWASSSTTPFVYNLETCTNQQCICMFQLQWGLFHFLLC